MSTITFRARFDGQALVPSEDVPLEKGREYVLVAAEDADEDVFELAIRMATNLGPPDLSERLDEYTGRLIGDA